MTSLLMLINERTRQAENIDKMILVNSKLEFKEGEVPPFCAQSYGGAPCSPRLPAPCVVGGTDHSQEDFYTRRDLQCDHQCTPSATQGGAGVPIQRHNVDHQEEVLPEGEGFMWCSPDI